METSSKLPVKRSYKILGIILGISILLFIAVLSTGPSSSSPSVSNSSVGNAVIVTSTQDKSNCEGITLVATDEDAFDAYTKSSIAKDQAGIAELIAAKKAFIIPNCTKANVIDQSFTARKVRISEGEFNQSSGWVAMEFAVLANQ
ncbi:MAG TPA: hypothetical protein VGE62_01090 [Candidatus Paceibacterota bacterium]